MRNHSTRMRWKASPTARLLESDAGKGENCDGDLQFLVLAVRHRVFQRRFDGRIDLILPGERLLLVARAGDS